MSDTYISKEWSWESKLLGPAVNVT